MAGYNLELPAELIKNFKHLENNTEQMLGEMTRAGAEVIYNKVKTNMKKVLKVLTH